MNGKLHWEKEASMFEKAKVQGKKGVKYEEADICGWKIC